MDTVLAILFGVLIYFVFCLIIAGLRALFSKPQKRKDNFKKLFGVFSLKHLILFSGLVNYNFL